MTGMLSIKPNEHQTKLFPLISFFLFGLMLKVSVISYGHVGIFPFTHPWLLGWDQKYLFLKVVMLHIKLKGKEVKNNMQAKCLNLCTPLTSWFG